MIRAPPRYLGLDVVAGRRRRITTEMPMLSDIIGDVVKRHADVKVTLIGNPVEGRREKGELRDAIADC